MFIGNSWKLQTWQWTTYHKLQKRFLEMCKRNFESEKENGIFIFLFFSAGVLPSLSEKNLVTILCQHSGQLENE